MNIANLPVALLLLLAFQPAARAENLSSASAPATPPASATPHAPPPQTAPATASAPNKTADASPTPHPLVTALRAANPDYPYEPRTLSIDEKKGIIKIRGCRALNNIAPLGQVNFCTDLTLHGCEVDNLEPIKKFKLTRLDVGDCRVADLTPLQGMPITDLIVVNTPVKSLEPLRGMPLRSLNTNVTTPSFYEVLGGCKTLENLELHYCVLDPKGLKELQPTLKNLLLNHVLFAGKKPVDLDSFREQPLASLKLMATKVADWNALTNCRTLKSLHLTDTDFDHTQALNGLALETLIVTNSQPRPLTITGIHALPLQQLTLINCLVDLKPLAGSPVKELTVTPACVSGGFEALRACPGLTTITTLVINPGGKQDKKTYSGATAVADFLRDTLKGNETQ